MGGIADGGNGLYAALCRQNKYRFHQQTLGKYAVRGFGGIANNVTGNMFPRPLQAPN